MHIISISNWELVARLALSIALGLALGAERERVERAAGMRTYALVSLGSTVFMLVSAYGLAALVGTGPVNGTVGFDPFRVAAQVATGIGFLGAGLIVFRQQIVRGLTTAAGLWVAAGIGLATGAGMYVLAVGATVGTLIVLAGFWPIEARMFGRQHRISINVRPEHGQLAAIRQVFSDCGTRVQRITLLGGEKAREEVIRVDYSPAPHADVERLIEELRDVPGFLSVDRLVLTPESEDSGEERLELERR
jgi:putative Mg2+ transporter-C (MgtC) family protein